MSAPKTVVILGGGVGGLVAAIELRKQLPREHRVVLAAGAQRAVREMARVLVPGGRLVLGELGRLSVWAAERRVRGWLGASTWRHAQFRSRSELAAFAQGAGLHAERVRGSVFFPPSGLTAQLVAPVEPLLARLHAPGAAYLALAAHKPESRP